MKLVLCTFLLVGALLYSTASKAAYSTFTTEESEILRHKSAEVNLTKQGASKTICSLQLEGIKAKERIELFTYVQTTNDTGRNIGVTYEVMSWHYPTAQWYNIRKSIANPNQNSQPGGGNISPAMHHWPYFATAVFVASGDEDKRNFTSILYAYSTQPKGSLTIHGCFISVKRFKYTD